MCLISSYNKAKIKARP